MRKTREEKAITLIALIITIVVLLILAAVAISAVTGDGIIQHAVNSRDDYEKAQNEEEIKLLNYLNVLKENNPNETKEYKAYSIGDEVTIGTETFYVIEDSDKTQPMVKLLARNGIDTENLVQSADANTVAFCEESVAGYWGTGTSPYNIEEPEPTLDTETGKLTLPTSHIAAKAAYDYGAKVGGTGRLMKYSEAEALSSVNSDMLYGINGKSSSEYLDYWLGSVKDDNGTSYVLIVFGQYSYMVEGFSYGVDTKGNNFVVRPVVEVLKSKIS